MQELKPVAPPVMSKNKRRHIFDMGQNMVGWVRLRVRNARPGRRSICATRKCSIKTETIHAGAAHAAATDHYTTRAATARRGNLRAALHLPRVPLRRGARLSRRESDVDDLTGVVVHSDCEPTGEFECSIR
jgi:alpha-L-rhamnosidase